ncbi:MAG: AAA family ATPase [Bryobacterales bacterium]|nr:AAA family ATPase [Bryobacterales bacterium]
MARFKDAQTILAAAETWKRRCLIGGQSLFTEEPWWTRRNFEELRRLYVDRPIETSETFLVKLKRQLDPGPKDLSCLWAEMEWVYRLIAQPSSMLPETKRKRIREIWSWSGREFPGDHKLLADNVLGSGVAHPGTSFHTRGWEEYRFFVAAMLEWFSLDGDRRRSLSQGPWEFASWLDSTQFAKGRMFRHALLFLIFPESFESIVSSKTKKDTAWHFGHYDAKDGGPTDEALLDIRIRLERESGDQEVRFDQPPYNEFVSQKKAEVWFRDRFGQKNCWQMNMNVVGEYMWPSVAEDGVASIGWDRFGDLRRSKDDIRRELISRGYGPNPNNRTLFLWEFANKMNVGDIVVATLKGEWLVGWGRVTGDYRNDSEGGRFRVHTRAVDWHVCDVKLQAFGAAAVKRLTSYNTYFWWIRSSFWLMRDRAKPLPAPYGPDQAHEDLFIPRPDFDRILASIKSGKNLILQGPPGTGKTFMARRIAWCLIGRKENSSIEMVQFHQSYAYEDFVQGYRPTGNGGFELKDGVFHRFCERARDNPDTPHVFIVDEINRGNLSRIFGELLMLIERDKRSRDYAVALTYSDRRFHVPANVFILGMMNTADRSLAMVDYALRRRFAFQTLEPAYEKDDSRAAFESFLSRSGADPALAALIADRMRKLNQKISNDSELGSGFQIGHSYFVPSEGDEPSRDWYKHVVDTQIAPLLREYWFDSPEDVENKVTDLKAGV